MLEKIYENQESRIIMQYSKLLNLCVCFMIVFTVKTASSKRQKPICTPCADFKEWKVCDSDGNDICITNIKDLIKILQEIVHAVQVNVTGTTDLQKSESAKGDGLLITVKMCIIGLLMLSIQFVCMSILHRCGRKKRQKNSAHSMTRNTSENTNTTTHLLVREKTEREDPDLSLQRSFFKRNIDATLTRSELKKLKKSMKSVGILFWNKIGQGTVMVIGSKYILTAWHVIEPIVSSPGRVDHSGMAFNSMNANALNNKDAVYLDFSENTVYGDIECRFRLLPKLCLIDKHLDACILEVDTEGTRTLPEPIYVFRDFEKMNKRRTCKFVHVIGQHPETPNIVVDTGCKIISQEDKKVKETNKWIKKHKQDIQRHNGMERDLHRPYNEAFGTSENLIFDTFLEFGASGGAVISFTPDGEVALVAILIRGLPSWFWTEQSCERGFEPPVRMEVGCLITEILKSKEWIDSEKVRIFGNSGHIGSTDDTGDKMETDQSERGAFAFIGPSKHGKYTNGNAMETDQLEKDAVDVKMSAISLNETC